MDTFYSITPDLIGRLDSKTSLQYFSQLLWAQARRRGVPITKIHFSLQENVPDGGIDAAVDADAFEGGDDVLVQGKTFYQVKTGTTAAPWQPGWVQGELFRGKEADQANLGSVVRACLDSNGCYVLVCFGRSLSEDRTQRSKQNFMDYFARCGYPGARVEVWGQEILAGLFSAYPSLCLAISGRDAGNSQSHTSWGENDDMSAPIEFGDRQRRCVEEIQGHLRSSDVRYVRIVGEPGVGKTRLALEATRADDLAPCVVYVPHAEEFQKSPLFTALLRPDAACFAILVLDECSVRDGAEIWNVMKNRSDRCSVVAIDHEPGDNRDAAMREIFCPPLDDAQIEEILRSYVSSPFESSRWAKECGGSPRVAHALGANLKENPDDLLRSPGTVRLWERFVAGRSNLDSPDVQQRLVVLRHLSLFARFGYEEPVHNEAQSIAELARAVDPSLTWGRFQSVVESLRKRRIIQGKRTLFIVPRMLQVHLWREFWNNYGRGVVLTALFVNMPHGLRRWLIQMLPYTHTSSVAECAVDKFLGRDGVFSHPEREVFHDACTCLSDLAEAAPEATLRGIEQILVEFDPARFSDIGRGSLEFAWALEKIAVWRELCERALRALLKLAGIENSRGQVSTTFAEFFSLATGPAAPTEAEPDRRLPVLKSALTSAERTKRSLGLKACRSALSTYSGGRSIGREHQGLRPTAKLWTPHTWGELFNAYAAAWNVLVESSRSWPLEERREANDVLMDCAPRLLFYHHLDDIVLATLESLPEDEATDQKSLIGLIAHCCGIWQTHVSESAKQRLKALDARITGTTLLSRLRRLLLLASPDEHFEAMGGCGDWPQRAGELAQEVLEHRDEFECIMRELTGKGAAQVYAFGRLLAERDTERGLTNRMIAFHRTGGAEPNALLLGGYLRHVYETDRAMWQRVIEDLFGDPSSIVLASELVFRTGLTKPVFRKLLAAYDAGNIEFSYFSSITVMCRPEDLDQEDVLSLLTRWNSLPHGSLPEFSLQLLHWYYCRANLGSLPEEITLDVLHNDSVYNGEHYNGYYWEGIIDRLIQDYPGRAMDVLQIIMEQVAKVRYGHLGSDHCVQSVSSKIIQRDPKACWTLIATRLTDPRSAKDQAIWHWLNSSILADEPTAGLLSLFPIEVLLEWIAEVPHIRAPWVAESAPKSFDPSDCGTLTRQLLVLYGDQKDVRIALSIRFSSHAWSGLLSEHCRRLRERARGWLAHEEHATVRCWLEDYIEHLTAEIENEETAEERRF